MYFKLLTQILFVATLFSCTQTGKENETTVVTNSSSSMDRTILPIKAPTYAEETTLDARGTKAPERFEIKAPEKAPNVVIVLIDDQGFGTSSSFGGQVNEPTLDKLANNGITRVEVPHDPDYHFTTDMTNQAINWASAQQSLTPDKPFYMYFAPGATHAPHHSPKQYIDKYKGKFDQGLDKYREETFERQKALGIIPKDAVLTSRPNEILYTGPNQETKNELKSGTAKRKIT